MSDIYSGMYGKVEFTDGQTRGGNVTLRFRSECDSTEDARVRYMNGFHTEMRGFRNKVTLKGTETKEIKAHMTRKIGRLR